MQGPVWFMPILPKCIKALQRFTVLPCSCVLLPRAKRVKFLNFSIFFFSEDFSVFSVVVVQSIEALLNVGRCLG